VNKRVLFTGAVVALAGAAAVIRSSHTPQQPAVQIRSAAQPAVPPEAPVRRVVYVAGAVARPGVYELPPGARVQAALRAAGGALPGADLEAVNLARPVEDGEEIAVPRPGELVRTASAGGEPSETGRRRRRRRHHGSGERGAARRQEKEPPAETVDVNAASAEELETLPGIGPSLAERIVTFRETNGPFGSAEDLLDVNGMNDRRLEEIEPYIETGGKAPRSP
jgi:competence protein ComEA